MTRRPTELAWWLGGPQGSGVDTAAGLFARDWGQAGQSGPHGAGRRRGWGWSGHWAGHFVNTGRRNVDLTYILLNNEVYGLTKGQAAPTLAMGLQTKSLPEPTIQGEVNALMLALASGFTWIGRGYAFNVKQLVELVQRAIRHPGLTFLEVLQPCPTYNDLHTKDWFAGTTADNGQPRVYALDQTDYHAVIPEGASEAVVSAQMQQFVAQAHEWVSVFQPVSFWKIGRFQVLKCASPRVSPATGRPLQLGGRSPMRKGGRWRICVRSEATSVL